MASDGGSAKQRGPPAALTALSPVTLVRSRPERKKEEDAAIPPRVGGKRRNGDLRENGSRGAMHVAAARHYRAPKHTSCIIPPDAPLFSRTGALREGAAPRATSFSIIRPDKRSSITSRSN